MKLGAGPALLAREHLGAQIFQAVGEPLLLIECPAARVVLANAAAERLYDYPPGGMSGLSLRALCGDAPQADDFLRLHRDRVPLRYHRRRDGSHLAVAIRVRYLEQEGVELAVLALGDYTLQHRDERAQAESERRHQAVFEAAPYPILLISAAGGVLDANPGACALYRHDRDALCGRSLNELIEDDPAVLGRLFIHRPTLLPESRHRRADGSGFIAETTVSYLRLNAQPMAVMVVRDLTETRKTLQLLQAAEERWRFALEGRHGDGVWDWDIAAGKLWLSERFRELMGAESHEGEVSDAFLLESAHPEDVALVREALRCHRAGLAPPAEVVYRLRCRGGQYRWAEMRGSVMARDSSGRPWRVIGTVRDVHEVHEQSDREQLRQRELAHAGRLILLGEMASVLAHELNQPLTALRNFASVAMRRMEAAPESADRLREPLQMIASEALRAGEIIRRVRGFVKKGGTHPERIDPNELLHSVAHLAEFDARAQGARIKLACMVSEARICGDRLQIEQVLWNLVRNGLEAMSEVEGEKILTLGCTRKSLGKSPGQNAGQNLGLVRVFVQDCGTGIDESTLQTIFDPFFSTKKDGLGLGLAICRSIVEAHGSQLQHEPRPEGGACFFFELPEQAHGGSGHE